MTKNKPHKSYELIIVSIIITMTILLGSGLPAQAETYTYVTNYGGNTVSGIYPMTNTVMGTHITVGTNQIGFGVNTAGMSVNLYGNTVSGIYPTTNTVTAIPFTAGTNQIGFGVNTAGMSVNPYGNTLSGIYPMTNTVTGTPITVGTYHIGEAVDTPGTCGENLNGDPVYKGSFVCTYPEFSGYLGILIMLLPLIFPSIFQGQDEDL